jgi:hypothetical protein
VIAARMGLTGGLFAAAMITGTAADVGPLTPRRTIGGYEVLAADFHVHMLPFGWALLSPWDTVIEASRQGLDVVALTPHEQVWQAKVGAWWSRLTGGPEVVVGEEITAPAYHMIALGISEAVSSDQSAADAIDAVHRQGGIAIAAHPYKPFWPAYDPAARERLDGTEVVRPESWRDDHLAAELREFFATTPGAVAIGSSDYHGLVPMGYSRTYVFSRSRTPAGVLEAIRQRRVIVYARDRAFGDPALIRLASEVGVSGSAPAVPLLGAGRLFSRVAGALALVGALLFNGWLPPTDVASARRPADELPPSA